MNDTLVQVRRPAVKRRRRLFVVLAATLAAALVWVIAVPLLGIDVRVPDSPGSETRVDLELPLVVLTAAIASLAGWGLLALLERFTPRAFVIWAVVAVLVLLLTLPYASGFTGQERAVLTIMHVVVAAVLTPGMRTTTG